MLSNRTQVANICDGGYLGIRDTLSILSPFLQPARQNPHATFITLFLNAVKEAAKWDGSDEEMGALPRYLPMPSMVFPPSNLQHNADMLRIWDARDLTRNVDKYFEK
jgi:hypothetical protein